MKFRVLGCSGGQLPGYNLSSFLIDDSLLIDAGSTTAVLTLAAQQKIRDILVTHIHLDHVMALGTLADNLYGKCKIPINVWSVRRVIDGLAKSFFNNKVWPDFTRITGPTQRVPVLRLLSLRERKATTVGGHSITAIGVGHVVPTLLFLSNRRITPCFMSATPDQRKRSGHSPENTEISARLSSKPLSRTASRTSPM